MTNPLRVIQWATGRTGSRAMRAIIDHPQMQLVGLWVHSKDKIGMDAGDLCDRPKTRVLATNSLDEIISLNADCVLYYVKINGEMHYLWRAIGQEGEILESYVTKTRDKKAALTFMEKALSRHGSPEAITTDGLRSYKAAMNELGNAKKQEVGRWANNRVENSHLPVRRRERAMLRFRRMKTSQKVASLHANVHNHFNLTPLS